MNIWRSDVKLSRKFALAKAFCQMKAPYFFDILFGKLGRAYALAFQIMCMVGTSFLDHVRDVVELSADKQMLGITAWRIIATVQHLCVKWVCSMLQIPRDAMSRIELVSKSDLSVPEPISARVPFPTRIGRWLINFVPEAPDFLSGELWYRHRVDTLTRLAKNV